MAYSTVPNKATGDTLAASDWNTYVRDNLADHEARIGGIAFSGCLLTRASNQSIPDTTLTNVTWTAETTDQGGWFTPSGSTVTVPAGALPSGFTYVLVQLACQLYWDGNATGTRRILFLQNGSEVQTLYLTPPSTAMMGMPLTSMLLRAVPGDTFSVQVSQTSGGALFLLGATQTLYLSVERRGYI